MPDFDWQPFLELPGAKERNFELVCHAAIRRAYGRYGQLSSVRVQPVVEFVLRLDTACDLGDAGHVLGWQCKWWPKDTRLTTSRKDKIEKAFEDQPEHIPDLKEWILWTPAPLSASDWDWIRAQQASMRLQTWHHEHLDELLVGDAEPLRASYFGDLRYTPELSRKAWQETQATLQDRYLPSLHVPVRAQRSIERALGKRDLWNLLERARGRVTESQATLEAASPPTEPTAWQTAVDDLRTASTLLGRAADEALELLAESRPADAVQVAAETLRELPTPPSREELAHRLRAEGDAAAADALETIGYALEGLHGDVRALRDAVGAPLLVAEGSAGFGKTHLAAGISCDDGARPAGALVAAREVRNGGVSLDDLARLAGFPAASIEQFLSALNELGARHGSRLPLVIDGLNESADPAAWQMALSRLRSKCADYPHVVVVATVRPSYADMCLPSRAFTFRLTGFDWDWRRAARLYFEFFKIAADVSTLPSNRFNQPLFLRVFCEAIGDPAAAEPREIGLVHDAMVPVFEEYLRRKLRSIRGKYGFDPAVIREDLERVVLHLWESQRRRMPLREAKGLVGENVRSIDDSVIFALADESLLERDARGRVEHVAPTFDAFAGQVIAAALSPDALTGDGRLNQEIERRLVDPDQPFAEDVRAALSEYLPADHQIRLTDAASGPGLRRAAAQDLILISPSLVTDGAAAALRAQVAAGEAPPTTEFWDAVFRNRHVADSPFNAVWLDELLSATPVAVRDLTWTEWVRDNEATLHEEIERLEARWRAPSFAATDVDGLAARWLPWICATTDRFLRDRATSALYWLGRATPNLLHERALSSLAVDDPYVAERVLAAVYGVAMANQLPGPAWLSSVAELLRALDNQLIGAEASAPCSHWAIRDCVIGINELARRVAPDLGRPELSQRVLPLPMGPLPAITTADPREEEARRVFGMDFANYSLGRLIPERLPYGEHPTHDRLRAEVLGRVWQLGWRRSSHGDVDIDIAHLATGRSNAPDKVERYGKKYSWIGFWEAAGREAHAGSLDHDERLSDSNLDPSFPVTPPPLSLPVASWLGPRNVPDEDWVANGVTLVAPELLHHEQESTAWTCLGGFLSEDDQASARRVFAFVWGVFCPADSQQELVDDLRLQGAGRFAVPEGGDEYYTFAGEIPWARIFGAGLVDSSRPGADTKPYSGGLPQDIELENAIQRYAWESYHSVLNNVDGAEVPSPAICRALGLTGRPQTFDLFDAKDRRASRSYASVTGLDRAHLVYLRQDLLERYCEATGQAFVQIVWGERELHFSELTSAPAWYPELVRNGASQHLQIVGR